MSKTIRTHLDYRWYFRGDFYYDHNYDDMVKLLPNGKHRYLYLTPKGEYFINRKARDRKPWNKPPKWFKQQNRRWERAKVKQAIREHKDPPRFKKYDCWEWT